MGDSQLDLFGAEVRFDPGRAEVLSVRPGMVVRWRVGWWQRHRQ